MKDLIKAILLMIVGALVFIWAFGVFEVQYP